MTTGETIALTAVAIWLAILTVACVVALRLGALADLRLRGMAPTTDGPLGASLAASILAAGPQVGDTLHIPPPLEDTWIPDRPTTLIFLTGTCVQCKGVAAILAEAAPLLSVKTNVHGTPAVVVLAAGAAATIDEIFPTIPEIIRLVRDPDATTIARSFGISTMPYVLELNADNVVRRAQPIQHMDTFRRDFVAPFGRADSADSLR